MISLKNVIEIKNLIKKYDSKFQLGKIDLNIPSGTIVGLIGENGAGKTTLIKSILNIIKIDQGKIKIMNHDHQKEENNIKEDIGVVLDNAFFPEILTPKDINSCMKNIFKNWDSDLFNEYIKKFNLPTSKTIKTLSKGMRKKLEIITALSHHPKLLILDEPTSGLDPIARTEVLEIFQDFIKDENHTVLLSTHITSDLENIADYIIFIDKGKVILNELKDEIIDNYGILKCSKKDFSKINKQDIIKLKENKYNIEMLIKDKKKISKKYKELVIDKITIEKMMILMIKGEEIC